MREILFRGKDLETKKWVTGYHTELIEPMDKPMILTYISDIEGNSYIVYSDSIGQYTERKDKTGVNIFEGDIVKINDFIYQVEFRYSEWEFRILSKKVYCFPNFDSHTGECEIIGNIHDNPELLEVKCE